MDFINARLLEKVAYGTSYGVGYSTDIKVLRNGHERRTPKRSTSLGRFAVMYKLLKPDDHQEVLSAFHVAMGMAYAFRLKDLTDFEAVKAPLAVATGLSQTIQLHKTRIFGPVSKAIPVVCPVQGTIRIYADDQLVDAAVNYGTGEVTFTAPNGSAITWSGQYDKKVRFDSDNLDFSLDTRAGGQIIRLSADIPLQEVFE